MWSVESFLSPKIGHQKLAHKSKIFVGVKFGFFSKCHEHGCSCWKAEFQPKFYKCTSSQLFAWLFTLLRNLASVWWCCDEMRAWENHQKWVHCTAASGRALQALRCDVWSEISQTHGLMMHLQVCWHGKIQHQWSIYFLKQSLAALIGRVMIIMDTIHGFGDMHLFLGTSHILALFRY